MTRRILVTSALPYANGPIHMGHLVEYIQTDIWVRFQRLVGKECVYVCADDTHGTAIMMRARQEGTTELDIISRMNEAHRRDFEDFEISFDNYGSTHSEDTRLCCVEIWQALKKAGLVESRAVEQLFDPAAETFLADRFVKGQCPRCDSADQYGDNCDRCGATYSATELRSPRSTLTGTTPVLRSAEHLFVTIEKCHAFLHEYTQNGEVLEPSVANYLAGHFLAEPLRDWDISRPAPYFGFEIPDHPGHYWYVWFDAPIGYIGSTREWCGKTGQDFDSWWRSPQTELHHFIGKDIAYFHTLFWPAMLKTAGFNLPTRIHVHGFLTVNGEKMSKSKGTLVRARIYLNYLDPSYLRYFYASKLGPRPDDLDLNLDEFEKKVNSDLVGKVVNLASRSARFLSGRNLSAEYPADDGLFEAGRQKGEEISQAYEAADLARAMRAVMALADRANEFVDRAQPWVMAKDPARAEQTRDVCTIALNLFRQLAVYLAPVLPRLARQCGELLNDPITSWEQASIPLLGAPVGSFSHMLARVEPKKVQAMMEASQKESEPTTEAAAPTASAEPADPALLAGEPLAATCSIEDFGRIDLRVARVVAAESVPDAKKLLKLTLSLGGDDRRQVFAGIKSAYDPNTLVGRLVVMVANLAPRQMKFGISEGMIVAASAEGVPGLFLISPDSGAKPGMRLR